MVGAFLSLLCRGYLQPACRDTQPPAHLEKRPDKVRFAVRACPHSSYLAFHLLICTLVKSHAFATTTSENKQGCFLFLALFPAAAPLLLCWLCRLVPVVPFRSWPTHTSTWLYFRLTFVVFVPPGAHAVSRTHVDFCVLLWL